MKTWHLEACFDALLLGGVALATAPSSLVAWLGALAVWLSARHASVADRLREAEEERQLELAALRAHRHQELLLDGVDPADLRPRRDPAEGVRCVSWLDRYWVGKELCWVAYFALLGAWPALVGALRFLAYPYWRRAYRRWRPRRRPPRVVAATP